MSGIRPRRDDRYYLAMDTMARQILANAAEKAEWEDYPEIGEEDWLELQRRLRMLAPDQRPEQVQRAYRLLENRARQFMGLPVRS